MHGCTHTTNHASFFFKSGGLGGKPISGGMGRLGPSRIQAQKAHTTATSNQEDIARHLNDCPTPYPTSWCLKWNRVTFSETKTTHNIQLTHTSKGLGGSNMATAAAAPACAACMRAVRPARSLRATLARARSSSGSRAQTFWCSPGCSRGEMLGIREEVH